MGRYREMYELDPTMAVGAGGRPTRDDLFGPLDAIVARKYGAVEPRNVRVVESRDGGGLNGLLRTVHVTVEFDLPDVGL